FGIIKHHSINTDKGVIPHGAAMQHGLVPHGDALANVKRHAQIHMQYSAVLNVGVIANGDGIHIGAHHSVKPHTHIVAQHHRAHDLGTICHPKIAFGLYFALTYGINHFALPSLIVSSSIS